MYADITTDRLHLRPMQDADPAAVVQAISDINVTRFLANVPSTYTYADAVGFISSMAPKPGQGWFIYDDAGLVGGISTDGGLGYWLRHSAWGKGYMTEAGDAVLDAFFADSESNELAANHALENTASGHVLAKLGFAKHDILDVYYPAKRRSFLSQSLRLTRTNWQERRSFQIKTKRLTIRESRPSDWQDFQKIAGNATVAPMLGSVSNPWPQKAVEAWLQMGQYRGRANFRGVIELPDGTVVGMVGMGKAPGPGPLTCAYFLDQKYWGKGLASEALHAFLLHFMDQFCLTEIEADHFDDNPASGAVLRKLGFTVIGTDTAKSVARVEAAPVTLYRLKRHDLKGPS